MKDVGPIEVLQQHEPRLTERDARTLYDVVTACQAREGSRCGGEKVTPLDIGGTDGSHHSRTLRKLVKLGMLDVTKIGPAVITRGSNMYEPSAKCRAIFGTNRNYAQRAG